MIHHYPSQKPGAMLILSLSHNLQYPPITKALQFHLLNTSNSSLQPGLPGVLGSQIGPGLQSLAHQSMLYTIIRVDFPSHKSEMIE